MAEGGERGAESGPEEETALRSVTLRGRDEGNLYSGLMLGRKILRGQKILGGHKILEGHKILCPYRGLGFQRNTVGRV